MVEVRITVPDCEAGHAVDAVMRLPVVADIETECLGEDREDREKDPGAVGPASPAEEVLRG